MKLAANEKTSPPKFESSQARTTKSVTSNVLIEETKLSCRWNYEDAKFAEKLFLSIIIN